MLNGITVVDLSLQLPGPYCTTLLAALGARVIKVEPPGGDPARELDPTMFGWLAAGKTSIVLDLRTDSGREVLHRLVERADLFVEGFRPGVADRLGAGYAELSARNPRIVYVAISGYGQTGPYRDLPGHDLNYLGVGGGMAAEGPQPPPDGGTPIGLPVVDLAAASAAAFLAVAALLERASTGRGRYLDVAMLDHATYWSCIKAGSALANAASAGRPGAGIAGTDGEPTYGLFRAADGSYLSIGVMEDKFWRRLCQELEWADFLTDDALATYAGRKQHRRAIIARLKATIATRSRDEWLEQLIAADLPVAPVHEYTDLAGDPQLTARRIFAADATGGLRLLPPVPPEVRRVTSSSEVPALGSGTGAILDELSYARDEQVALRAAGAFGSL